jgi:hypothetical protein
MATSWLHVLLLNEEIWTEASLDHQIFGIHDESAVSLLGAPFDIWQNQAEPWPATQFFRWPPGKDHPDGSFEVYRAVNQHMW